MNPRHSEWLRLAAAARHAPVERDETAPYGFATRVAALGLAAPAAPLPRVMLEKLALRGFFAACVLSVAAVVFGYSTFKAESDSEIVSGDVVTEMLAQS